MDKHDDHMVPVTPVVAPTDIVPASDDNLRRLLVLFFSVGYLALLVMLHVYWLSFNHPDLQSICLVGDGIFAGAASGIVNHYLGVNTANAGILTGLGLKRKE